MLTMPFLKQLHPDLHWWLYVPFAMFVIVGCSNAVNLTDGLDGLAIGPVMTVALLLLGFHLRRGQRQVRRLSRCAARGAGAARSAIFCAALIAASMGFLWYNAYPASMMMGDVGALSLGGALGTVAVLAKQELVLPIAGGVFVLEAVSVIMQRYYLQDDASSGFSGWRRFIIISNLGDGRRPWSWSVSGLFRSCADWSR